MWEITAQFPFSGTLGEGFRLGDTEPAFQRVYRAFPITTPQVQQTQIVDADGTDLGAGFDAAGIATTLILADTNCADCVPTTGTQGGGEGR